MSSPSARSLNGAGAGSGSGSSNLSATPPAAAGEYLSASPSGPFRGSPLTPLSPASLSSSSTARSNRPTRSSSPVLLHPLPPSTALERESRAESALELQRQTEQARRERLLAEALQDQRHEVERIAARGENGLWADEQRAKARRQDGAAPAAAAAASAPTRAFTRPPQAYELYKAIDKRDIEFISRVRDHCFQMLLQKNAAEFPIIYAARIGPSHREIVIMLVGAFSRYVNNLDEEQFKEKDVQNTLKMLRTNLKMAIDNALLPAQQSHLLSSYLQVLIMSEGDAWVHRAAHDVGLLMRGERGEPAAEAADRVRRFSTRELRGVPGGVNDVEEYIANAALDLVILAAWGVAAGQTGAEPLPTYTFARDLRTWTLFAEAMQENRARLPRVNRRTRHILAVLEDKAGDSRIGVQARLRAVREAIDRKPDSP